MIDTKALRALAVAAKGWDLSVTKPEEAMLPCRMGATLDGEFHPIIELLCEDYYQDSEPLAEYITATQPATMIALLDALESVQADAARYRWLTDDHRSIDQRHEVERIGVSLWCRGKGASDAAIDEAMEKQT